LIWQRSHGYPQRSLIRRTGRRHPGQKDPSKEKRPALALPLASVTNLFSIAEADEQQNEPEPKQQRQRHIEVSIDSA